MVRITLDGPNKNALGTAMLEGFIAQLEAAGDQPVLLTGAGSAAPDSHWWAPFSMAPTA